MISKNSVLIEITSSSIIKILNALDILKQNDIAFTLLEETNKAEPKPNTSPVVKVPKNYKLGKKGVEILECLSEGLTYNEIAEKTEITVDGVRYYVKKIFKALNVNNGRDAVRVYLTELR